MGLKHVWVCDSCGKTITKDHPGLIVHGNVYVADYSNVDNRGGIIGNNFDFDENGQVTVVKESVYCVPCLTKIITESYRPTPSLPIPRDDNDIICSMQTGKR